MNPHSIGDKRLREYYNMIVPYFNERCHDQPDCDYFELKVDPYFGLAEAMWVSSHLKKRFHGWQFKTETLDRAWTKIKAIKE